MQGFNFRSAKATLRAFAQALCCAGAAMALTGTNAPAQTPATAKPAVALYRISGTVVNAITGEAVPRVSVAVLDEEESRTVESVLTDSEGRFSLAGLPAAKYQLTASRRGFRTAYYDEHDEFSTAIVTGPDQDTSALTFRLTPGAVLRGVVTGDGGDPVEGARVMLFKRPTRHAPGERIAQVDATDSDDTGAYEFGNLPAGDYYLAVTAEPWYALRRSYSGASASDSAPSPLDVAFPLTYFDSTTDEASATAIALAAGATEEASIDLHAVPALHLAVEAPHRADGSITAPELRTSIFGTQISSASLGGMFDPAHPRNVEFTGIAPGHYELLHGDPPRVAELDATASEQVDPAEGTPTVEVSGAIKSLSGAAPPQVMAVDLEPADGARARDPLQASVSRDTFHFPAVLPGKWNIAVSASGSRVSVISAAVGNAALAANVLTVADRPLKVNLTVAVSEMSVRGFARRDGKGLAGVMVVLVPKDLAAMQELARRDQSDSDGSFNLLQAAPGEYTVVAIQDGWDLEWWRPEIIHRFLSKGTPVRVTGSPTKIVALSQGVEVQSP
jgi:5-hydroxyisourate hydrolase-like protein (transthyretin family)